MASLELTTSSPDPQTGDSSSGMTHAGADGDTIMQRWIGGLPPELWVCIMRHQCPHCYLDPPLKSGVDFEPACGRAERPELKPTAYSNDLQSMTMTCRGFRYLAQIYVFHCFDSRIPETFELFRTTINRRPDLASAVRDMFVSSNWLHRCILRHIGNIHTLTFRIHDFPISKALKIGSSKRTLVASLKYLKHLTIMPVFHNMVVDVAKGRLWLDNLMDAAHRLERLRCCYFTDFSWNQHTKEWHFPPKHTSLNYARLPENKLIGLELLNTWFAFHSLERLLQNFKGLREFRHSTNILVRCGEDADFDNEIMRPVDGHDVITLLKPLKQQLEKLEVDFRAYPEYQDGLSPFRPIGSLAEFTSLKAVRLSQMSIGDLPGLYTDTPDHMMSEEEYHAHRDGVRAATTDFFVKFLPCKTLEFLQIDDFDEDFDLALVELARHAGRGGLPRLKHVRLLGEYDCHLDDLGPPEDQAHRYHDVVSLVPERFRWGAKIRQAMCWDDRACEAEDLFRGAGVSFERVQLSWPLELEPEIEEHFDCLRDRMVMYPQPCAGGCGKSDCVVVKSTP